MENGLWKEWEFEICWLVTGIIFALAGMGFLE
jgi:hypothetical protein